MRLYKDLKRATISDPAYNAGKPGVEVGVINRLPRSPFNLHTPVPRGHYVIIDELFIRLCEMIRCVIFRHRTRSRTPTR